MESSLSVPVSLDGVGAAAQQEDEDSYPSTAQTVLRQHRVGSPASSHDTTSPGEALDSDLDDTSSLVGSRSQTETAAASAAAATAPHTLSAENILLMWKKTSLSSGPGGPGPEWAKSSSDSALTSERPTLTSSGVLESSALAEQQASDLANQIPHNGAVGSSAGSDYPLPLSQASWRAEPEGCSAATDTPAMLLTVVQTPPIVEERKEEEEESEQAERPVLPDTPTHDHTPSPTPHEDGDPATTLSDTGSESTLALRVAELLQRESSAFASTSSTAEPEGSRAAGWRSYMIKADNGCVPIPSLSAWNVI